MKLQLSIIFFVLAGIFCLNMHAEAKPAFSLTIIHVNDTHSKFDSNVTKLTLDLDNQNKNKPVYVEMGGFPRVAALMGQMKKQAINPLLLHAGDFFQGSLYFTQSQGESDVAFWNTIGLDAATFGNHEFDYGPSLLAKRIPQFNFPLLGANLDFSNEPLLKSLKPQPWIIKNYGKDKVGIIGSTTVETPYISSPGKAIQFLDVIISVQKSVDELTKAGVNKIVLISHSSYAEDLNIAASVRGIDVIVGGHSHSLLGDWASIGLGAQGSYPTKVSGKDRATVLVVQAWEWAKVIGNIKIEFDALGTIVSWQSAPQALVGNSWFRIYDLPDPNAELRRVQFSVAENGSLSQSEYDGKDWKPISGDRAAWFSKYYTKLLETFSKHPEIAVLANDPAAKKLTADWSGKVNELRKQVVAQVKQDLIRGLNSGPGPIIADAMRAKTGSQIAISNAGGIRTDLLQGPLTVAQVYELIPFGNTLVTLKISGSELVQVLEDAIDYGWGKYGPSFPANPLTYVSGIRFQVQVSSEKGKRIQNVALLNPDGSYTAIEPSTRYSLVVNNFSAAGGDKYTTLAALGGKTDTGFIDAEALLEFVKDKTIGTTEERILVIMPNTNY